VLIQRSEGGGLGIGTSQGMGSFMSGRGTANLLTRTTAVLGALFFTISLGLALLTRGTAGSTRSLLDAPVSAAPGTPPAVGGLPALPAQPVAPAAPQPAPRVPTN
jgi:preprotein translocase subunit SecG